jgi:hypothetical protein
MQNNDSNLIHVRYDQEETGWATRLPAGLALIENIPLSDRCNLHDVVTLESPETDGLPWVGEIVHRRYAAKTILYYHGLEELRILCSLLSVLGCETEGARRLANDTPGVLLVAHDRLIRPDLLAAAAGVPQHAGTPTRVLLTGGALMAETGGLRLETQDGAEVASWQQADWTADPGVAATALDTLHRCLCQGVAAAQQPAARERPARPGARQPRQRATALR